MNKYRIGVSADFMRPDGKPAFPDWDMSPLDTDHRIDWAFVPTTQGVIRAQDLDDFDALILLSAHVGADSIPDGERLGIVARFGVGFDNVDVDACTLRNIAVTTTPDGVRRPVAVAIITQILALAGHLFEKDRLTRLGPDGWAQKSQHMGTGLQGRVLGSIGMGNIAREMFRLASVFDLEFIAHDPFADADVARELGVRLVDLETVFKSADFLAINCPLNVDTVGLVNAERLAMMRPSAYLINTARGPIVDQKALVATLQNKQIAGAALDVFEREPVLADDPVLKLKNVILTPHGLSWTDQCFAGIGASDIAATVAVMEGRNPNGVINPTVLESAVWIRRLATNADRYGS
jgi:phosphoglycerate dehydrogenase-like enzyme